jgi:hypothetical protein
MKIVLRIILLAALAGLGFWLWTVLFPGPEKIVLRKIAGLAETASFGTDDGNFTRASKVSNLIGFFSADAQIVVEISGVGRGSLNSRDEIREAAAGGFTKLKSLEVKFLDAIAIIGADWQSATVNCTAEIHINDGNEADVQELRFEFRKIENDWRITRVETVKTLQ